MAEAPNSEAPPQEVIAAKPGDSLIASAPVVNADAPKSEMPPAFEGGAEAWGKLDDAGKTAITTAATEKAAGESKARTDALTAATTPETRKAAYEALTKDEKIAAFKGMDDAAKAAIGATDPEAYTDFTLPEGMTIDAPAMEAASALFKESGLSQEQAQKFIDLATSRELAAATKGVQAYADLQNKWVSEIKADPEIGGSKLDATVASCKLVIDRLAIPGLKDAMNLTGAGNNPAIVKAFARLGKMMSEDKFASGNSAETNPKNQTPNYYGDGPKQSADAT
jgi:hypothetical protein